MVGNSKHDGGKEVSLSEFQAAVRARHASSPGAEKVSEVDYQM